MTDHTVIVALITVGGLVIVGIMTNVTTLIISRRAASKAQVASLELKVDGQLAKFIKLTEESSHAEGVLEANQRHDRKDANIEIGKQIERDKQRP